MRRIISALFCLSLVLLGVPAQADPPVFHGKVIMPFAPFTIPSGGTLVLEGDSITYGRDSSKCSTGGGLDGLQDPVNQGTCYADLLATYFNATEVNNGQSGQCLVYSTNCTQALINHYQSQISPYASNTKAYITIMIGVNDAIQAALGDTGITQSAFQTDYDAMLTWMINTEGINPNRIVLGEITYAYQTITDVPYIAAFNQIIAREAQKWGVSLASTYDATGQCAQYGTSCLYDSLHPNDTGYQNVAAAFEAANYATAWSAQEAFGSNNTLVASYLGTQATPTFGTITLNTGGGAIVGAPAVGTNQYGQLSNYTGGNGSMRWGNTNSTNFYVGCTGTAQNCDFNIYANGTTSAVTDIFDYNGNLIANGTFFSKNAKVLNGNNAPTGTNQYIQLSNYTGGNGDLQIGTSAVDSPYIACTGSARSSCTLTFFTNGFGSAATASIDSSGNYKSLGHNVCSATSGVPCETTMTCSLSAATTCSATVTVPASSVCVATPNGSDTTTVVEQFKTSLSSTTLTVTELATASQTATAAANVHCL